MALRWWRRPRAPAAAGPSTATGHMRSALHHVLAGDLAAAEVALAEAARLDSSSADVYLALANLYRARGEIGRAIQIHQNVLLRPELDETLRREALLGLALDFRAGGFLQRAASSFEELLAVEPRNVQGLRELERIKVESGAWEEAIRIRRRIGGRDPRSSRILAHLWVGRGRAALEAADPGTARRCFNRALGHDRACAEAYVALGDLRESEGRRRRAVGLWQRALPLHPALGRALYPKLFEAARALDDLGALERLLLERIESDPDELEAALWLARVLVADQRIDEGLNRLRRLLDRASDYLPAYAELGRVLLREHREAEIAKVLEELLEQLPLHPPRLQCRACGTQDTQLHWRCPQCGEWDTFQ